MHPRVWDPVVLWHIFIVSEIKGVYNDMVSEITQGPKRTAKGELKIVPVVYCMT